MSVELVALAVLMAAVTYPSRALPLLLPGFDRLPPIVDEYLRLIGPGILASLAAVNVLVIVDGSGTSQLHLGPELLAVLVCVGRRRLEALPAAGPDRRRGPGGRRSCARWRVTLWVAFATR